MGIGDRVDGAGSVDPKAHLAAYFEAMIADAAADIEDIQLVVRALLEASPEARHWPLRPYLDRLIALVRALPGQAGLSDDQALAEAYGIIGSLQYLAISGPTIEEIYGRNVRAAVATRIASINRAAVARMVED